MRRPCPAPARRRRLHRSRAANGSIAYFSCRSLWRRAAHLEIADQGTMIGKAHVGHVELRDLDAVGVEHEIELLARVAARIRRQPQAVWALEARSLHEQEDHVDAPGSDDEAWYADRLAGSFE